MERSAPALVTSATRRTPQFDGDPAELPGVASCNDSTPKLGPGGRLTRLGWRLEHSLLGADASVGFAVNSCGRNRDQLRIASADHRQTGLAANKTRREHVLRPDHPGH